MENQKKNSNFFSSVSEVTNLYYKEQFKKYIEDDLKTLDFGCGTGELLNSIKSKYKIGVEINTFSQKELLRKKILFVSKLEKIKKGIKFNTIFALSVLDHLQDPVSVIKQLSHYLAKNGNIIIVIRHDDKKQNPNNSSYQQHLYSWSLLSFNNLLNKIGLKAHEWGVIKMTLPPLFKVLKKILGVKMLILISKFYYYLNFNDRRFYFICKKR